MHRARLLRPMVYAPAAEAPGGTDPYYWYPALDLNDFPPHTAAGAWGAQLAVQTPAAPVITGSANASNLAELEAAMGTPGTRVTLTASILSGQADPVAVTDVEIIVPNGIVLNIVWGGSGLFGTNETVWTRVRWTKASGDSIGGQLHQFALLGGTRSDIVVDGLQLSAQDSTIACANLDDVSRLALVNNQMHSVNNNYAYGSRHVVVAGNSCKHNSADGTGPLSAWGYRCGAGGTGSANGPYIFYQNDIRGTTYFQIRFHPSSGSDPFYAWVKENILLDRTGGAMIGCGDTDTSTGYADIAGLWYIDNTMYINESNAGLSQTGTRADASPVTEYWRINGNTVHGSTGAFSAWGAADSDTTGNTYNPTVGSDPAWTAAGDPTGIDTSP
jgi:hypothetical protein